MTVSDGGSVIQLILNRQAAPTGTDDASPLALSLRVLAQEVRNQWHDESRARGLYSPAPLPVPLVVTSGPLSGQTGTATTSAELLGASPNGRLVITGPRGSGKTTCAMLLVESLLTDPRPGTPVPILLSLSSWDPEAEELRSWVARRLTEDYPGALTDTVSAHQLAGGRHLLPVLDGLEEIAENKRSLALRRIGEAYDSRDPLVLTCTDSEFNSAVEGGGSLTSASVVLMLSVPLNDVTDYLRPEGGASRASPWDMVLPALAMRSGMTRVLGSPVLVALLRTHYELPGRDPKELLSESEFPDAMAVEHRLLDDIVPAAFAPRPAGAQRPGQPRHRWPQPLAERWLRQLARHTHSGQLKWWQLSQHVLGRHLHQVLLGAVAGALWFAAAVAVVWSEWEPLWKHGADPFKLVVLAGPAGVVAVAFGASFAKSPAAPSQMWQGIERIPGRLRRARRLVVVFGKHMAIGSLGIGGTIAIAWLVTYSSNEKVPTVQECAQQARDRSSSGCTASVLGFGPEGSVLPPVEIKPEDAPNYVMDWQELTEKIPLLITLGLAAAFVAFAYGLLASAPARDAFPTPRSSFSGARRQALGTTILQVIGLMTAGAVLHTLFQPPRGVHSFFMLLTMTVALWNLSRSAWGQYHVAHWVLALRGHVPWPLMAFCEDAHRLNVLRQAGSAYEFQHETLRERLTLEPSAMSHRDGPAAEEARKT
ncbi:hypothetical protein ACWC1D_12160 [Streptomyces sp. NPDC001478]